MQTSKALLLSIALLLPMAHAQTAKSSSAASATLSIQLPKNAKLDRPVTVITPVGTALPVVLTAITRAAGLTLLSRDLPTVPVTLSFKGLTTRAALERLLSLYSDKVAARLVGDTLIVAPPDAITRLEHPTPPDRTVLHLTLTDAEADRIANLTGAQVIPVKDSVIISGTAAQVQDASHLLSTPSGDTSTPSTDAAKVVYRATEALGQADPELAVKTVSALSGVTATAAYGHLYLQASRQDDLKAAQATVGQLRDDAAQAPTAPKTAASSDQTRRTITTSLATEIVNRLAAGITDTGLKITPLEQGSYLVRGSQDDLDAFEAALKAATVREALRVVVTYPNTPSSVIPGLQDLLPNATIRASNSQSVEVRATPPEQVQASMYLKQLAASRPASEAPDEDTLVRVPLGYARADAVVQELSALYSSAQNKDTTAKGDTSSTGPSASAALPLSGSPSLMGSNVTGSSTGPTTSTPATTQAPPAGQPNATSTADALIDGVHVVPDLRTRSILLQGPSRTVARVQKTIADLDIRVPDIRMALKVEQVTGSNGQDLGLNWKAGVGGFSIGQTNGNLNAGFAPGLALPNFQAQLALAHNQGRANTLLDTTFISQDGQPSNFTNGGQILLPTGTSTTNTGTSSSSTTTTTSYNYGLSLALTPRLAPDGSVEVQVQVQIGQQPTTGVNNSVIIGSQTLNTLATVKPGELVVLGGILQNNSNNTKSGIPGLSEIPVLGNLFGTKQVSQSDSLLLITLSAGDRTDDRSPTPPSLPATGK